MAFQETVVTLIEKLQDAEADANVNWWRFAELYEDAIKSYARQKGSKDPDDTLQEVNLLLLDVFQNRKYDPAKGKFRAFLKTIIKNAVLMSLRKAQSRPEGHAFSMDGVRDSEDDPNAGLLFQAEMEMATSGESVVDSHDQEWVHALYEASVKQVMRNPAISPLYKKVYRFYAMDGHSVAETAKTFGIDRNLVSQIKVRVWNAIKEVAIKLGVEEGVSDENR